MLGEFAAWEGRERPRHFTQQVRQVENAGEMAKAGHWLAAQLKPGCLIRQAMTLVGIRFKLEKQKRQKKRNLP